MKDVFEITFKRHLKDVNGMSISKLLTRSIGSGTSFGVDSLIQLLLRLEARKLKSFLTSLLEVTEVQLGEKGRSSSLVRCIDGIS